MSYSNYTLHQQYAVVLAQLKNLPNFSNVTIDASGNIIANTLGLEETTSVSLLPNAWGNYVTGLQLNTPTLFCQDTKSVVTDPPVAWFQRSYTSDANPTTNLVIPYFVVNTALNTTTGNNYITHAIEGYSVNNGCQDAVGVAGRTRRISTVGAAGTYSCGVWGSSYHQSAIDGGVMGLEGHIYHNSTRAITASDRIGAYWSLGVHLYSNSTTSRATGGIGIDCGANYGYWNGMIIDGNAFSGVGGAVTNGDAGTVGVNMGSWSVANGYGETGVKFGQATQHVLTTNQDFIVNSFTGAISIYNKTAGSGSQGTAGLNIGSSSSTNAFINFRVGTTTKTNIFFNNSLNILYINNSTTYDTNINSGGSGVLRTQTRPITESGSSVATTQFVKTQSAYQVISTTSSVTNFGLSAFVNITTASITITLPDPSLYILGEKLDIWNSSGGTSNLVTPFGSSFQGVSSSGTNTQTIATNKAICMRSIGTNWVILSYQ